MAIDREAINDTILKGLGRPNYLSMSVTDPLWKANADRWKIPYDPKKAKELLREAGFPAGFTVQWWVGPAGIEVEVSEAVAAGWLSELNVKTEFDRRVYSAQRPALITREVNYLQTRNCCYTHLPELWAGEWIMSSAVPTGYNHGLELPKAAEAYYKKLKETDPKEVLRLTVEARDYYHYWMVWPSTVEMPSVALYSTKAIADWKMRPFLQWRLGGIRNVEWIRPVQ
jgi:ABC-type transport system substrate-binding protein